MSIAVPDLRRYVNGNGRPAAARTAPIFLDEFRETMSRVPSPVTVVTTLGESGPHGTTVSAFCSLSAEPPLVLVALDRSSDLLALLTETRRFGVNLLAATQEELARACAEKGPEKFKDVPWYFDANLPRIEGAAAWLSCEVAEFLEGGDHVIVVGLVTDCGKGESEAIVYHRRRFLELVG
jgi:flavin reductase (DIM6/NTAB) family NADH-FMN oxidoreductase RutF